jgi:hypothetical protein
LIATWLTGLRDLIGLRRVESYISGSRIGCIVS